MSEITRRGIKDAFQKDLLCRHFVARGWYIQTEVVVYHRGGVDEQVKDVTDVDVLALRSSEDLRWELVLGDCRTLRNQSPANRVLWLRGLMEHFHASSGIIILKRDYIEPDHKLFAATNNIRLIAEDEFARYDQAIVYPSGSLALPPLLPSLSQIRELSKKYPALRELSRYLYGLAWNESNRLDLVRKVLGELQAVSREIDPANSAHLALVLDAVGVFAVGLAECIGIIFNQYLQPETIDLLDDALKVVIWGGRTNYDFIAKLRSDLLTAKHIQIGPEGPLALPEWALFVQLVRNVLESPHLAFHVAPILRQGAINVIGSTPFLANTSQKDLLLLKYAMLTVTYVCRATKLPPQTRTLLEEMFTKRQSDLIHQPTPIISMVKESIKAEPLQPPLPIGSKVDTNEKVTTDPSINSETANTNQSTRILDKDAGVNTQIPTNTTLDTDTDLAE